MAKMAENATLDAALNIIKGATRMTVCSAAPANQGGSTPPTVAQVNSVRLAEITGLTGSSYTGPVDGTTSGRKVTVNAQSALSITASGTATHVVLDNGTSALYSTTCTSQALVSGGTVNVPLWVVEIADPT